MTKILFVLLLLIFFSFHSFSQNNYDKEIAAGYKGGVIKNIQRLDSSLNFCVIGDWGRHGEFYQKAVADKLADAIAGIGASFIISTGDNLYPNGVVSEYDPSWQSSFENVYARHETHVNWYVALGNHDYKSNPDAEVAYSKISQRWNMPARYFSIKKRIGKDTTKTAEFFFIDTSPFEKDYYSDEDYEKEVRTADTTAQKKWLINALKKSTATWKFMVGHHPLYSAGMRKGKLQDFINSFQNIFEKYKVDAYFCGHEHQLEYDEPNGLHFKQFISGAGSEARPVTSAPYTKFTAQDYGFLTVSLTEKELLFQFIDFDGKILYTNKLKK
ncbi:MAG: metallophosphoesterase [Chitinophagaceae bacterium]